MVQYYLLVLRLKNNMDPGGNATSFCVTSQAKYFHSL